MNNRIKKLIIVLAAVFTLASCNDWLTLEDPSSINTSNFPSSVEQCNLLLNSCYASNHLNGLYSFYWFPMEMYLFEHTSDIFGAFDERSFSAENNTLVANTYTTQSYIDIFKMIVFANTALEGVEKYREKAPADETADLDYVKGQALFFRALGYWHGQIFYEIDNVNGKGLPIFRKTSTNLDGLSIPRNTTGECYAFMAEDLEESARLLAAANKDDKFRVGEWAAKGLLAKVYMQGATSTNGYWTKARSVMEDIILTSGKALVPFEIYEKMFYGSPYDANEFNSESLYEIDMITNPNQNGPWAGYTMGSGMPMVLSPTLVKLELSISGDVPDPWRTGAYIFPSSTALESGWINNYVHDANVRRFGFAGDTMPLLKINPDFVITDPITIDNYPYTIADDNYIANSTNWRDNSDPRLMICAAQPWFDSAIDDKGRPTLYNRAGAIAGADRTDILGWWHKKFMNLNGIENTAADKIHGKNYSSDANIYVVRLADIYLLYAECMQNLGETATALEYVNKVHRRAYGYPPDGASPVDYASLSSRTKALDNNDILANDVIKYERWAELFGEAQWWWDVRRWKIGQNEVNIYKEVAAGTVTLNFRGNAYYVQPIPQYELDRNKGMEQSEGY